MNKSVEVLLGDNPFFGIDHLSQERARMRMKNLNGFDKITEIMDTSYKLGAKGFVVSTHPQLKDLIKFMKKQTNLLEKMEFYPILPYAHGYVSKVTEKGILGTLNDVLSGSLDSKLKILFKGSVGFLKKDFNRLLQTITDVELLPLNETRKKIIFLHDVVTDLAISLGFKNLVEIFMDHIKNQYGVQVGLVTKNFPKLVDTMNEWNIDIPIIMTSFNPLGYQMNPTQTDCEKYLKHVDKIIAMNVLAGGLMKPLDSAKYISKLNLDSIVVGMSTVEHVKETIDAFHHNEELS